MQALYENVPVLHDKLTVNHSTNASLKTTKKLKYKLLTTTPAAASILVCRGAADKNQKTWRTGLRRNSPTFVPRHAESNL
jgi:hypothetical protein